MSEKYQCQYCGFITEKFEEMHQHTLNQPGHHMHKIKVLEVPETKSDREENNPQNHSLSQYANLVLTW